MPPFMLNLVEDSVIRVNVKLHAGPDVQYFYVMTKSNRICEVSSRKPLLQNGNEQKRNNSKILLTKNTFIVYSPIHAVYTV